MFIPRHPVVEDQFCSYGETNTTTGVGGVVAYAGSVVYLDSAATNEEPIIFKMKYNDSTYTPFGFLMQKVKTGYHQVHPNGFVMPGDLGSSDAIAQSKYGATGAITGTKSVPAGVAHLGIYDTVHYTAEGTGGNDSTDTTLSAGILPGQPLRAAADEGKVTNDVSHAASGTDYDGEYCAITTVARVMKGASVAKVTANIANTTLYPIRIKLLI